MGRIQLYKEIMECLIYSHSVLIGKHMAAIICRTVEDITAIAHVSTLTKKAEVLLPSQEPVLTTGWVCCAAPLVPCPSRLGLDQTKHYVPSSQTTWICSVPSEEYWGMRAAGSFLHGLSVGEGHACNGYNGTIKGVGLVVSISLLPLSSTVESV